MNSQQQKNIIYRAALKIITRHKHKKNVFIPLFNTINKLVLNWPITIINNKKDNNSIVQDNDSVQRKLSITRLGRFEKYKKGVSGRLTQLQDEYFIDSIEFMNDDIFFDIGANIGEVSLAALERHKGIKIYAFEPDPIEFEALQHNLPKDQNIYNCALWEKKTTLSFFENNETGDSSIFPNKEGLRQTQIKTNTLDNIYQSHCFKNAKVRLLKIEAEGAEPEILRGARLLIDNTQSIVVDVGRERGLKKESTLPEVANLLYEAGFYIKHFHKNRDVVWFERKQID